jgi:hypothetical protein
MSANLPITWLDKKNSPELEAFLKQYGDQYCMKAEEINQLRDAVNEMALVQQSTFLGAAEPTFTPAGTGRAYWIAVIPGTYANHGGVVVATNEIAFIIRDAAGAFSISKTALDLSTYSKKIDLVTKADLVRGKNLFDKSTVVTGYYILSNGNLQTDVNFYTSDFILVNPSTNYFCSNLFSYSFFTSEKVRVSSATSSSLPITPSNCYYLKISGTNSTAAINQLELGITGTTYESYSNKVPSVNLPSPTVNTESIFLFNRVGFIDNSYVLNSNASYETTDYLKIDDYAVKDLVIQGNASISGVSFYDKNLAPIGYLGRANSLFTFATLTIPTGTEFFVLSKAKNSTFSAKVLKYSMLGKALASVIAASLKNTNALFLDTNTQMTVFEKKNGYYINGSGVLSGGGTFPEYYVESYQVTAGSLIKAVGTGVGSISAIAFYSDATLTTLIAKYGGAGAIDMKLTVPAGATYAATTSKPTAIILACTYVENNKNALADLTTKVNNLPSLQVKIVIADGDSLTAGAGGTPYPTTLQNLIGSSYLVVNAGVGGETTNTIAARQGGMPFLLQNAITIPSTTADVPVVFTNPYGATTSPLLQGGSSTINPCVIDGIECTLTWDSTNGLRIRRNVAGTVRNIPINTPLNTNYMKIYRTPHLRIIWMGTNAGYSDTANLVAQHKAMFDFSGVTNKIIIGLHYITATYTLAVRQAEETEMRKAFGSYYINWRVYCTTNALGDAGITPTTADNDAIALGKCPPSLLSDAVHLNTTGYTLLANLVNKRLNELGII